MVNIAVVELYQVGTRPLHHNRHGGWSPPGCEQANSFKLKGQDKSAGTLKESHVFNVDKKNDKILLKCFRFI